MGLDAEHRIMVTSPSVGIIGAGPAGLIAAETLAREGCAVTVYERMPSVARKLLMAGRGGLNLTHSEPLEAFITRYDAPPPALLAAIRDFPPAQLIAWADALGQDTFTGTSGRVFPRALKASPLVRAWLARLGSLGVTIATSHAWQGWTPDGAASFATAADPLHIRHDALLLAAGGASWPRLGSNGHWAHALAAAGVATHPFQPSNCAVAVTWSPAMARHYGQPLKRIALATDGDRRRGEIVLTARGVEGGALYALVPALRRQFAGPNPPRLEVDLRPDETLPALVARLSVPRGKQSTATFLRKALRLSPPAIALLYEAGSGALPKNPVELAAMVKAVPIAITGLGGLERAISSVGGLPYAALDDNAMIKDMPGVFAAGEMLDWDAPTGGYLLQACFATGVAAARGIQRYLSQGSEAVEHAAPQS